ncbi:MAG: hypothetical protein JSW71_10550 [Gemmatimonadota bacterium]|nr:MAG: hypothetical protein JSW71_10550 [Gemmatimonadota bacterium]
MRPIACLLLVGLLTATPVLAQTEQEAATTNGSCVSSSLTAPSTGLQSWTPSLAPTNAADLMLVPLAQRLAFTTADSLAAPEPAPMSEPVKVGLIILGVLVVVGGVLLIICLENNCFGG